MLEVAVAGFEVVRGEVASDWIDVNGHMNVANYLQAFDDAVVTLRKNIGVTEDYVQRGRSTFAVECHMTYQQELKLGDPYVITAQILAYSETGIHQFNRMYHAREHFLAATAESMTLHVDLEQRMVVPWPDDILRALDTLSAEQGEWPYPVEAGRQIRVRKPIFTTVDTATEQQGDLTID